MMSTGHPNLRTGSQLQFSDDVGSVRVTIVERDGSEKPLELRCGDIALAQPGVDGWVTMHDGNSHVGTVEFLPAVAVVAEAAAPIGRPGQWALPSVNPNEAARAEQDEIDPRAWEPDSVNQGDERASALDAAYCGTCGDNLIECRCNRSPHFVPSPAHLGGHSRSGSCGCGWSPAMHGNVCPEHGTPALLTGARQSEDRLHRVGRGQQVVTYIDIVQPTVGPALQHARTSAVVPDAAFYVNEAHTMMTGALENASNNSGPSHRVTPIRRAGIQGNDQATPDAGGRQDPFLRNDDLRQPVAVSFAANGAPGDQQPARGVDSAEASVQSAADYHASQVSSVPDGFAPGVIKLVRERGSAYGCPSENHQLTADMLSSWLSRRLRQTIVISAEDVCMINVLQKLSRLAFTTKDDSWFDVAGYTENVAMLKPEQRNK